MQTKKRRKSHSDSRNQSNAHSNSGEQSGDKWTDSMERSRDMIVTGLRNLQDETIRMIDQRLERDVEAIRDYRNCRNVTDIFAVQQRWFAGLSMDMFEGGMRMGQLMQGIVSEEASEMGRVSESAMRHMNEQQAAA